MICAGSSPKLTLLLFFLLTDLTPSSLPETDASLGGTLEGGDCEKFATGEAVRTEDAGECFRAGLYGDRDLGGGSWRIPFGDKTTGAAEKCACRPGLRDASLPFVTASRWRLAVRVCCFCPDDGGEDAVMALGCTAGVGDATRTSRGEEASASSSSSLRSRTMDGCFDRPLVALWWKGCVRSTVGDVPCCVRAARLFWIFGGSISRCGIGG